MPRFVAARSIGAIASLARQRVCGCQAMISRVQQTGRGHQLQPAVLGHPDAREVQVPELIGALDAEDPRPPPTLHRAPPPVSRRSRITRSTRLRFTRRPSRRRTHAQTSR
jgi:hypothetical protein